MNVKNVLLAGAALVSLVGLAFVWMMVGAVGPALPLRAVGDFPLTGNATRFDYASLDQRHGIMWVAHMGDGSVEAFEVKTNRVTLTVPFGSAASVRGVLAVRGNVYAAAQGVGLIVFDSRTGQRIATVPAGDVDGLAYDPVTQRLFVSDEGGGQDVVIDARTNRTVGSVALGGEAGNTQYDPVSHHIFVGVQTRNQLAEIDPMTLKVMRRYDLPGCISSHSVAIGASEHAAYIGCQRNARVVRLDLRSGQVTGSGGVGIGVDVLALDSELGKLYVASESGVISVYDVADGRLKRIAQAFFHLNAHVVALDPATHRLYFPLANDHGQPMMRVMEPQ